MIAKQTPSDPLTVTTDADQARALKLWVVLVKAQAAIARHAEADATRDGLTTAEFGLLEALLHKGRLRTGELQESVLVTSGGMTYLVDRLAARGLVQRIDCPEDRRVRYVELTRKGDAMIRTAFERHANVITQATAGLGPYDQEAATRLLKKLGQFAAAASTNNAK